MSLNSFIDYLIKERNYNVCYIEWRNKNTGFISRGQLIMLDNSKKYRKYRGIEYCEYGVWRC